MWAEEVRVPRPGTSGAAFLGWALLGAGVGAGLGLGIPGGLFVALALVLVGGLLVVRQGLRPAQLGVVTGLAALPFALAWLNRRGPGPFCSGGVTGASACVVQSNPWPYVLVGVALVVVGVVLFVRTRRV
ncbi:hypothetical protein [Cellulomonas terrae]|uniref:hypothetical protein n=1 Tax=Cellulomonas terrae TaxID=311234 RepID=UPI0011BE5D1D|nr:hypothetical protein [Cellulomonas terrae]